MRLMVKLLVACAATIGRVADALDTQATRLDPSARTREWVRDYIRTLDFIEDQHRQKARWAGLMTDEPPDDDSIPF